MLLLRRHHARRLVGLFFHRLRKLLAETSLRRRYQLLSREEIAHTVATPSDIEDELRHLISVVAG
jgi:hypothetical protein